MSDAAITSLKPSQRTGRVLLVFSVISRFFVLVLLCLFAMMTDYINLKRGYNNPRLVELAHGKGMRRFYQVMDGAFSKVGDPLEVAQTNGGMTWSIRVMGVPFTDPIAALSVLVKHRRWSSDLAIGLLVPLSLIFVFGRVFCTYVCPASLLFFTIGRFRRLLGRYFYFPDVQVNRGLAWGILVGGLVATVVAGHGVWVLLLPYFAIGQTIFSGLAFGTLSVGLGAVIVFTLLDLCLGQQFTCRNLCPTGRLIGVLGRKPLVSVRRDADACIEKCTSCFDVCPLRVNPKMDEVQDCSLCGECLVICPGQCLTIGLKKKEADHAKS